MRTCKACSWQLLNMQYNVINYSDCAIQYLPWVIYFTLEVCTFWPLHPFDPPLTLGSHPSVFFVYEFGSGRGFWGRRESIYNERKRGLPEGLHILPWTELWLELASRFTCLLPGEKLFFQWRVLWCRLSSRRYVKMATSKLKRFSFTWRGVIQCSASWAPCSIVECSLGNISSILLFSFTHV